MPKFNFGPKPPPQMIKNPEIFKVHPSKPIKELPKMIPNPAYKPAAPSENKGGRSKTNRKTRKQHRKTRKQLKK